jgi:xanthine dehydrogenase accessory factor
MKNIATWKMISQSLSGKVPVILLYVLESRGSSPGRQGFFMTVNAHGEMEGSIGGGIMEHKFVEMAKDKLKNQGTGNRTYDTSIRKQIHDKSAAKDQSGMICSGEQTILLYQVKEKDQLYIQHIISSLEQNKNGTLILSPGTLKFETSVPEKDFHYSFQSEDDWLYKEKTGYKNHLFIIGGGHCSLALSKLMRAMDFYIHIYEERDNLKTLVENDAAHDKQFIHDYTVLKEMIPPGNNHYVVIMTFGYRTDDTALRSLLDNDFKYIGLLGSQYKTDKLIDEYRKEGITDDRLQRIHTPIGLAIKSQTPEEIAVSIAAEIIRIKNLHL